MNIELSELAFIVYSCLIIFILENYKENEENYTKERFTVPEEKEPTAITETEPTVTPGPPDFGFLPRNVYTTTSRTPAPGADTIENSYNQTATLILANPWVREEACLPIEGNIGSRIDLATEIFGPFERAFII